MEGERERRRKSRGREGGNGESVVVIYQEVGGVELP